jgi:hypothetical protein
MIGRISILFGLMLTGHTVLATAQESLPECRLLSAHHARSDVAFKPGVDVRGKPVVSADLNAAPIPAPQVIMAPLSLHLRDRLSSMNIQGIEAPAPLGFLEIHDNGRVVYDGRDLTPQVYALCGISGKVSGGQESPNVIKSEPVTDFKKLIQETAR